MAGEKKEKWLSYVATTTILFAVCATLATFKGGQYSTKAVLGQSKLANQWAYYQAKDLKSYMHELQKEEFEFDLLAGKDLSPAAAEDLSKKIAAYQAKIKKYDEQKEAIMKEAREFEGAIADSQTHSNDFGMAVIFLQIAILLSSIAALMQRQQVWLGGVAIGLIGVVYFVNGFAKFF